MKQDLISLLVCPVTNGQLIYDRDNKMLISKQAQLVFTIEGGVPNMLVDNALALNDYKAQFPDQKLIDA